MDTVDPYKIPKKLTRKQLQYWILFGICVANKPAEITKEKLDKFLIKGMVTIGGTLTPFEIVSTLDELGLLNDYIKEFKFGQYTRILKAFRRVVTLNLNYISVGLLESVPGIGPKTARMIMLYYDPDADCVPLDTHILKYLKSKGYDAPKSTPPAGKKYQALEKAFQALAKKQHKSVRQLDTEVWTMYAKPKKLDK